MTDEMNKIQSQVKPGRQSEEVQKLRRKGLMKEISFEFRVKQGWRQRKHRRTRMTIISQGLRLRKLYEVKAYGIIASSAI